jgi:hypothetical protein
MMPLGMHACFGTGNLNMSVYICIGMQEEAQILHKN